MEKPWKVIAAFVGVFIAGSIFGGLLAMRLSKQELALRRDDGSRGTAQAAVTPTVPVVAGQAQNQPSPPRPTTPVPQLQLPPSMAAQAPQLMRRYVDRLSLTPEQKERINPLIQRASTDLKWQQQTNLRQTAIVIQRLQEEIGKELTPVQRGKMQEMEAKQLQLIEAREKQQQEQAKQQQEKMRVSGQKNQSKDGGKTKAASGKTPEDGN